MHTMFADWKVSNSSHHDRQTHDKDCKQYLKSIQIIKLLQLD